MSNDPSNDPNLARIHDAHIDEYAENRTWGCAARPHPAGAEYPDDPEDLETDPNEEDEEDEEDEEEDQDDF